MEKFYTPTFWTMAVTGVNFGHFQGWKKVFINILLFLNLLSSVVIFLQVFGQISVLPSFLDMLGSYPKFLMFLYHSKSIKKIMDSMDEIFNGMDIEEKMRYTKFAYSRRRIVVIMMMVDMSFGVIHVLSPLFEMVVHYLTTGEYITIISTDYKWFPIDPTKHFLSSHFLQSTLLLLTIFKILLQDVMYMLILIVLITLYRYLGEKFIKDINQAVETGTFNKKIFKDLIEVHQTLNDHCNTLNRICGVPFFMSSFSFGTDELYNRIFTGNRQGHRHRCPSHKRRIFRSYSFALLFSILVLR